MFSETKKHANQTSHPDIGGAFGGRYRNGFP
jgi:hypothetical protein